MSSVPLDSKGAVHGKAADVRLPAGRPRHLDGDIRQMELALKFWAEQEGYCLAGLFHEYDTALNRPALTALIEETRRSNARRVITPSLAHLSTHPVVQHHLLNALEDTGVQVHTLQEN